MHRKNSLILCCLLFAIPGVKADQWIFNAAYQFETGSFSESSDTDIITVPVSITYFTENWGYGLEVPYVYVSGSSTVIPSGDGQSTGHGQGQNNTSGLSTNSFTRSGIGDISFYISHAFFPENPQELVYEVIAKAKIATADESNNFGTGENDYSIKMKLSIKKGHWTPGGSIGVQFTGDSSENDYYDIYYYSIGTGYALSDDLSINLGYDYKQAISDSVDDSSSINLDFTRKLNRYFDLGFGVNSGLSDNSPDYGIDIFMTGYY